MARPNARSSHREPVPQVGCGIAVGSPLHLKYACGRKRLGDPSGAQIWLATRHPDTRKGLDGLALLVLGLRLLRLRPIWAHGISFAMRIIARRTLREFVEGRRGYKDHAALKAALDAWFDEVKKARWFGAADVKRSYATASIVSADRIVFNIKGNDYRLVVATDFEKGIVWIKWLGTHKDYDEIDVTKVQHGR